MWRMHVFTTESEPTHQLHPHIAAFDRFSAAQATAPPHRFVLISSAKRSALEMEIVRSRSSPKLPFRFCCAPCCHAPENCSLK